LIGKVNFEEFLLAIKMASSTDMKENLRFAFRMYDKNNDSKLDQKEIENIILGINELTGHKEVNSSNEPKKVAENMLSRYDKVKKLDFS
jgi:Ca2+-binding EF-hand superfamily protein